MFKPYPKIHRLGKEETDGILDGEVFVQEKIDGANTSIWMEDGELKMGSRTRELTDGFNGFCDYVRNNKGIKHFFERFPKNRMYGEWLVRHTISYNETAYKKFYLFDVVTKDGEYWTMQEVELVAGIYGINFPEIFYFGKFTEEQVQEFAGKTNLGSIGEGVVLKRDFTNKFGDKAYAKVVTQKFKEENAITFGGNNKHSETYWEMYVVNKYCTLARVQKIMNKIQPEINEKLDLKHIPRVVGTCYHDMITEEAWEIASKVGAIDFNALKRLANKKFVQIYKDIISNNLSAYESNSIME